jgi:endonuclease YncB( thermonuclease family)
MQKIFLSAVFFTIGGLLFAQPAPIQFPPQQGDALVVILGVVDGDTVDFAWLVKDRGRLHGINAPEKEGATKAAGVASMNNLKKLAPTTPIKAKLHGREKYGRALVDFYNSDGISLSQLQIEGGFAVKWDGKGPRP